MMLKIGLVICYWITQNVIVAISLIIFIQKYNVSLNFWLKKLFFLMITWFLFSFYLILRRRLRSESVIAYKIDEERLKTMS
jgi:hypothetical protein